MPKMSELKEEYIGTAGYYNCVVHSHELISNPHTGNPGVSFILMNERLARTKVTFWMTQKALFKLAQFAGHCGLTDEEVDRSYCINNGDLPTPNGAGHVVFPDACHSVFHGRRVRVKVEKEGQYHNVVETMPAEGAMPEYVAPNVVPMQANNSAPAQAAMADDDLPF